MMKNRSDRGGFAFLKPRFHPSPSSQLINVPRFPRDKRRRKIRLSPCHIFWFAVPLIVVEIAILEKIQGAVVFGRIVSRFLRCSGEKVLPQLVIIDHYNNTEVNHMLQRMKQEKHGYGHPLVPCKHDQSSASLERLWAYNPWSRNLYLCGQPIAPNDAIELLACCQESPRVFQEELPRYNGIDIKLYKGQDKVKKRKRSFRVEAQLKWHPCTVPCRFVDVKLGAPIKLTVEGTNWQIKHTMESAVQYRDMEVKKDDWKQDVYYSTTSFESEIPLPYFSFFDYDIHTAPINYDEAIKGASFIASNCVNIRNDRNNVVKELMKMIRVDSLGSCLHNAEPPLGVSKRIKEKVQKLYLFHLAFENANEIDYITEKVWGTLQSGSLPVYMGAPNIKDHVPANSIISWHDFNSTRELGAYLQLLVTNKSLYESYHAWRFQPNADEHLFLKYNFTKAHSACRTCKWAYAKQRGLGWDHAQQEIRALHRSRQLCLEKRGSLAVKPFRELTKPSWEFIGEDASYFCLDGDYRPKLAKFGNNVSRTISYHDGVIDIFLEGKSPYTYHLATDFRGPSRKLLSNVYQLQDGLSRMTFAVDEGLDVVIDGSLVEFRSRRGKQSNRIRVITEDVDTFHQKAYAAMTYYGKLMISQFELPLQFFTTSEQVNFSRM